MMQRRGSMADCGVRAAAAARAADYWLAGLVISCRIPSLAATIHSSWTQGAT